MSRPPTFARVEIRCFSRHLPRGRAAPDDPTGGDRTGKVLDACGIAREQFHKHRFPPPDADDRGVTRMDWRHRAACRDEDPELFFPIGNTGPALLQIEEARAVCRRCEVVDELPAVGPRVRPGRRRLGCHERGRAPRPQAPHRPQPGPHRLTDRRPRRGPAEHRRGPVARPDRPRDPLIVATGSPTAERCPACVIRSHDQRVTGGRRPGSPGPRSTSTPGSGARA